MQGKKICAMLLVFCLLLSGCSVPIEELLELGLQSLSGDAELTVHFLDVGQADCALLESDGSFILIDGGNTSDSDLVVSYLEQAGVRQLDAVWCSHAHEDHVGGLPAVLAVYPTKAVYAPTRTYVSECFDDFVYYTDQQGLSVTIAQPGDTFTFGDCQVEVLGPVKSYPETNNTSLVLMVTCGTTRFLFTGDMETAAETDLLDSGADVNADVLKAGHHGSDTSSSYRFIYEVSPAHTVISVGEDNTYDHPSRPILSRLQDADSIIYRTDRLGHVIARSDGYDITFTWQTDHQPVIPSQDDQVYIGNVKSRKLHVQGCSALPEKNNQQLFEKMQDALDAGYTLCTRCME